jgi:hypothetical protein
VKLRWVLGGIYMGLDCRFVLPHCLWNLTGPVICKADYAMLPSRTMLFVATRMALLERLARLLGACFFAFVLPFICWGAVATPGHPHARPHFVFVAPELTSGAVAAPLQRPTLTETLRRLALASWCGAGAPTQEGLLEEGHAAAGQSIPAVLAVSLLAPLVLLAASLVLLRRLPHFALFLQSLWGRSFALRLSTPPPRRLLIGSLACG